MWKTKGWIEMSTDEHKAIARRFFEAFITGDFEDVLAPGYKDHDAPPGTPTGPEGIRQLTEATRTAFPDLRFHISDQIAEGDKVTTVYTLEGTNTGEFMGMPATGKQVRMRGISVYRIADGKLQEGWVQYDALGMLQQLGAFPRMGGGPN
jgi:steroid delta-isomerase-like uncharacterized protein